MLSGRSQGRLAVYGKFNNVSLGVRMSRRERRRGEMPRIEQRRGEIGKVSFAVGEGRLRREQQMEEMRKRILDMQYRMWYDKGLEMSQTFAPDTSDSNVQKQLAHYASMLLSEDVNKQLHATTQIEKLLSIGKFVALSSISLLMCHSERECPTTLTEIGVVQRFVNILMRDGFSELQYEASWVLVKIAYGTCANTKAKFVHEVVPCFVRLLDSPACEQAVLALGIVACASPEYRDLVLSKGASLPLLGLLGKHAKLSMLRNATWTLSNLFNDLSKSPGKHQVKRALKTLGRLLHSDDLEVLINSCRAIHGLSFISPCEIHDLMDVGLCPKLVELLVHSSRRVQIPVLLILTLIPPEETYIQALIDSGALPHLLTLLTEDAKDEDPKDGDLTIKREACAVLSCILDGNNEGQIQAGIKAKFLGLLVNLLESPDVGLQEEAAQAISNATTSCDFSRKRHQTIGYLVNECRMINPVCNLLSSPNNLTIKLGLEVLRNVLEAERSIRKLGGGGSGDVCPTPNNSYSKLIFEAGVVEKIEKIEVEPCRRFYRETCSMLGYVQRLLLDLGPQ